LATIDDHEIVDNFAGGAVPGQSPGAPDVYPSEPPVFTDTVDFVNETQAYRDTMQAFQEYHPIRNELWDAPNDVRTHGKPKFYRKAAYGSDAVILILDARSFRDAPLPVVSNPFDANEIEAFLKSLINTQLEVLDYDPIGLNENNAEAEGLIDAELLGGDYLACHTFGWAEFEIAPETQELLVTVYGLDAYSQADLIADPSSVINRSLRVVSQFIVHPNRTEFYNQ
jgi:hypothetical protein